MEQSFDSEIFESSDFANNKLDIEFGETPAGVDGSDDTNLDDIALGNSGANILQAIGLVSFQSQALEHVLASLYAARIAARQSNWRESLRRLLHSVEDAQLMQHLETMIIDLELPESTWAPIQQALSVRSWFMHRFFRESGFRLQVLSDSEQKALLDKLALASEQLVDANTQLNEFLFERQLEGDDVSPGIVHEGALAYWKDDG